MGTHGHRGARCLALEIHGLEAFTGTTSTDFLKLYSA